MYVFVCLCVYVAPNPDGSGMPFVYEEGAGACNMIKRVGFCECEECVFKAVDALSNART